MMRLLLTLIVVATFVLPAKAQIASNNAVYGRDGITALLAKSLNQNFNVTNTDTAVTVSVTKYLVRRVTVTNCSTSFGVSLATVGVFTGAGGTGTTVVALGTLTTLTGATKYVDLTLALTTDTLTAATLYFRNGVTFGSAATCDIYLFGDVLP